MALRALLMIAALLSLLWGFGPREDATLTVSFDDTQIGDDASAYLAAQEAQVPDVIAGQEKQIIWQGQPGVKTPLAVLYVHGFSASLQEIRPVPDRMAAELGANLVYTRLQGHGRSDPAAMAEASVQGWMRDLAEGIAVARQVGERVVILSTSTGGTLVAGALPQSDVMHDVAGVAFVSPNFGLNTPLAPILTWPAARTWVPYIAGEQRTFEPRNPGQKDYWTTSYPTVAILPMAALVQQVQDVAYEATDIPALFFFSRDDQVVRAEATQKIMDRWGGPKTYIDPGAMGPDDDTNAHVIAGDIMSPGKTDMAVQALVDWAGAL